MEQEPDDGAAETAATSDEMPAPQADSIDESEAAELPITTAHASDGSYEQEEPPGPSLPDAAVAAGASQPEPPDNQLGAASAAEAGDLTHRSILTASSMIDLDSEQNHSGLSPRPSSSGMDSFSSSSSRPMTGATSSNVRGSRPNSAAIAAQIEGFHNDFLAAGDRPHMLLDDVPEGAADDQRELTMEEMIAAKQQEYAALSELGEVLQHRAQQVLEQRNRGRPPINRDLSRLDGADTRYRMALKTWFDLRKEREQVATQYQTTVFSMKSTLEGRIQRAEEIVNNLKHFKREVALAAEHSKTGRAISNKLLAELDAKDHTLDEEVQRVRLKHIHLSNTLKKLEATLRNKEQLAEGLHLIDFEQLKIENQSLNEKIEERNDELIKLRKKTTLTVQILTHMKAKLAFVECENQVLQEDLAQLETALAGKRDEIASLKSTRDRLRHQGRQLREGSVFVTNPMLLQDMQAQKEKRDDLLAEIEMLKQQHDSVIVTASASPGGSRGCTAPHLSAATSPGRLQAPCRTASSKATTGLRLGTAPRSK